MSWEDEEKIIDITKYRKPKAPSIEDEFDAMHSEIINRAFRARREKIERIKRDNYIHTMINLLLITQSIVIISFIFILARLY